MAEKGSGFAMHFANFIRCTRERRLLSNSMTYILVLKLFAFDTIGLSVVKWHTICMSVIKTLVFSTFGRDYGVTRWVLRATAVWYRIQEVKCCNSETEFRFTNFPVTWMIVVEKEGSQHKLDYTWTSSGTKRKDKFTSVCDTAWTSPTALVFSTSFTACFDIIDKNPHPHR